MGTRGISLGVRRPVREADHSLPSSVEVKNMWNYISTPPMRLQGVMLSYKEKLRRNEIKCIGNIPD
jgi:hypothetical protein